MKNKSIEIKKFKIYQQKEYGKMMDDCLKKGGNIGEFAFGNKVVTETEFNMYYEMVCEAECRFSVREEIANERKIKNILEKVFTHFNVFEAAQDRNRIKYSLSVLDIVEVDGIKYQVVGLGYKVLAF